MVSRTREFFLELGYLETDTPLLSPSLIPESCLEAFATTYLHPYKPGMPLYLVPSPEIWMKRIIAETGSSVFQLCKSFRNAESVGRIHNPEFTMLEYYTVNGSSVSNIALTEELLAALAGPATPPEARPPFRRITMAEAFREHAGLDLETLSDTGAICEAARSKGLMLPQGVDWEEAFNIIFLSLIEPELPQDRPLVLDEYPAGIECLAKDLPGRPFKERWELYIRGIEIANCFTEMADPEAVRRYFVSQGAGKATALVPHRIDSGYADLFERFPPCSGVAVGFDRLLMVLKGMKDIGQAIRFPFSDRIFADFT
jgi:lysyl-tRNA synthetase class 2